MDVVSRKCTLVGLLGDVKTVNTRKGETHLYGDLRAMRLNGGDLSTKPLHWRVEPQWTDFEVHQFLPWTVVQIAGLLHTYDSGFQKFDVQQVVAAPYPDAELEALAADLETPTTYSDPILGDLVHDPTQLTIYTGRPNWNDRAVAVSIPVDEDQPSTQALRTLHSLWARQAEADLEARRYVAESMFDGTESSWWTQDGEPPTAAEFTMLLSLTEITIDHTNEDDGYTLWFSDGDVFGGHTLRVSGSLSKGHVTEPQM